MSKPSRPWSLCLQVEGILDRIGSSPPVIDFVTTSFQRLGYSSWAYRVLNTAGLIPDSGLSKNQHSLPLILIVWLPGFGLPQYRRRVFVVASYYGDARDVLLSQASTSFVVGLVARSYRESGLRDLGKQGIETCTGACTILHERRPCFICHEPSKTSSLAIDLGNAQ